MDRPYFPQDTNSTASLKGRPRDCDVVPLLVMIFILIVPCLMCFSWRGLAFYSLKHNESKWEENGEDSYTITIDTIALAKFDIESGRFTVCDGTVVKWENQCIQHSDSGFCSRDVNSYKGKNPILELFAHAEDCWLICFTKYDKQYGFPTSISGGLSEGGITARDFQLTSCGEEN